MVVVWDVVAEPFPANMLDDMFAAFGDIVTLGGHSLLAARLF
jgi:hypothetical protein